MNHLNSILIEGCISCDPTFSTLDDGPEKGKSLCQFTIESNRFLKKETGIEKEVSSFQIEAWGKLGEACYNNGRKGRKVRVVGKLIQKSSFNKEGKKLFSVIIEAGHAEFRPKSLKEKKNANI
jgi:single-strand DNA-binding protein